jgi:hypothetical protein
LWHFYRQECRVFHTGDRTRKRETVLEKLKAFFNRFADISGESVTLIEEEGLIEEK